MDDDPVLGWVLYCSGKDSALLAVGLMELYEFAKWVVTDHVRIENEEKTLWVVTENVLSCQSYWACSPHRLVFYRYDDLHFVGLFKSLQGINQCGWYVVHC